MPFRTRLGPIRGLKLPDPQRLDGAEGSRVKYRPGNETGADKFVYVTGRRYFTTGRIPPREDRDVRTLRGFNCSLSAESWEVSVTWRWNYSLGISSG